MGRHLFKVSRDALTPEMVRGALDYNPETGAFRWKISPANNMAPGCVAGTIRRDGYVRIRVFHQMYQGHRLAWFFIHGVWPSNLIDHIDGNPSNNSLSNLREATAFQNQHNRRAKGYSYSSRDKKFAAQLLVNGKLMRLGRFDTAEEARAAYLEAHAIHTGEFSITNRAAISMEVA